MYTSKTRRNLYELSLIPLGRRQREDADFRAERYLEKQVQAPSFLVQDGTFNQDASSKILSKQRERVTQLQSLHLPSKLPPLGYPSFHDNPELGSVEIPLISDVMSSEPVNYVGDR